MAIEIKPAREFSITALSPVTVDLIDDLDGEELLTGTPTVVEITTSALTLANEAVNTEPTEANGRLVPIGKAVKFTVTGGAVDTTYTVRVTVSTTSNVLRTIVYDIKLVGK
jgi:hypothetical protein